MTVSNKYTPALSRFPTDSSNDSELDAAVMTPPARTSRPCRIVSRDGLVPAHSPDGQFVGTPFSTSNMFEYPFHPEEEPITDGSKPISIPTNTSSSRRAGNSSNGSNSPTSPHYTRTLREVSREAPIPPSLREKVSASSA
ncbi:hypothetical protein BDV93DRAFT_520794 [Ceratobasidium sp. AG-I]|nr:hypothetical protein BDV93DRAFT_520794 [Ceratobasidium sp. AG-I]